LHQSDPNEPFFASAGARPHKSASGTAFSETGASISRAYSYALLDTTKAAAAGVERI